MIQIVDPRDPPEEQVRKLGKIVEALMWRVEQSSEMGGTPYSMFQAAINLENEVQARTKALQDTLEQLEKTHGELSRALKEAEQSRQTLLDALEAMSEGFALFSEERLLICNERFRNLLPDVADRIEEGMTFAEYTRVVASSSHLLLDEGQTPEEWASFRRRQHGRKRATFTVRLKGGRWIQVSDRSIPGGRIAILHTDITKMVQEQQEQRDRVLDEQARLARATIDHMSQGVCTFDSDHLLVTSNSVFADLLSLPFNLIRDGTHLDTIIEFLTRYQVFDGKAFLDSFRPWLAEENGPRRLHIELQRFDGMILDASFRKLPDGGFVASFADVTRERRMTQALARAKETLELRVQERTAELTRANEELLKKTRIQKQTEQKMREAKEAAEAANLSKTRFLAAASHDLLQPLNAAKLFIASLMQTDLRPGQAEIVESLSRSFNSVESILEALLDISRLDASGAEFSITGFDIDGLFDALRAEFAPVARHKGIELRFVQCSANVLSDRRYLQRIVQNLLSNAIKYTEAGKVLVGCRRRGGKLRIEVHDTGIGIARQDQRRIFEEFQRLDPGRGDQGMGLGLSFVERACKHLGHGLDLVSEPGKGSVFAVGVDIATGAAEEADARHDPWPVPEAGQVDVLALLIENDKDILKAMTSTLERWGVSVIPAASTAQAIDQMQEIGVAPDIIIADYHLDGEDTGLIAIERIREDLGANIASVIVTADRGLDLKQRAGEIGAVVLTKPLDIGALREFVTKHRP